MNLSASLWRTNSIRVHCIGEFDSSSWENEIERLWAAERLLRPTMFNGTMLSFVRHDAMQNKSKSHSEDIPHASAFECITVEACLMEYKVFIAKQRNPALPFQVMPTGVSGITVCHEEGKEYLAFARRSASVVHHPESLELVPSGNMSHPKAALNIKDVPFHQYLREEFREEFGLDDSAILAMKDFAVVFDESIQTYDMACVIHTSASRNEIKRTMVRADEYSQLTFVELDNVAEFIAQHRNEIVPTSIQLVLAYTSALESKV